MYRQLSLSTNSIEKITSLSGMENLRILALCRNQIKKIDNLDSVAETLEELWISYNILEKLVRKLHCIMDIHLQPLSPLLAAGHSDKCHRRLQRSA